jgi:hypothetical protein
MFLAWLYVIITAYGIIIACISFVVGYFYLFTISGFKKGIEFAKKDYDYVEGFSKK